MRPLCPFSTWKFRRQTAGVCICLLWVINSSLAAIDSKKDARLTQLIREVSLLPAGGTARPGVLNETVTETSAVKTGSDSRAELTFIDQTITRLGANSLYHFKNGGRRVDLSNGSTLLRIPKDSGGGTLLTTAVTVGITGTTVILGTTRSATTRLIVLEGTARLSLRAHPNETRSLLAGQALEIPAGAVRLSAPKEIDLAALVRTSPLIVGFRPLPSLNLINGAIRQQQQRGGLNQNQPNRPGPQGPQSPQNSAPPAPGPGPR